MSGRRNERQTITIRQWRLLSNRRVAAGCGQKRRQAAVRCARRASCFLSRHPLPLCARLFLLRLGNGGQTARQNISVKRWHGMAWQRAWHGRRVNDVVSSKIKGSSMAAK